MSFVSTCDLTAPEISAIRESLAHRYAGVFTAEALENHFANHVGYPVADWAVETLKVCGLWAAGTPILDIGAGFGSFVVRARQHGWNAIGIEAEAEDVDMGRKRLTRLFPGRDPVELLVCGDGRVLPFPDGRFQVATLWNVLEHVPDITPLIAEVRRVLVPGGTAYMVCPNYAANRLEAHYHLPMEGLVPRAEMVRRLRAAGRDPGFFETSIFYRTNEEVLDVLNRTGFRIYDLHNVRRMDRCRATLWAQLRHVGDFRAFHAPTKESVMLAARKD